MICGWERDRGHGGGIAAAFIAACLCLKNAVLPESIRIQQTQVLL